MYCTSKYATFLLAFKAGVLFDAPPYACELPTHAKAMDGFYAPLNKVLKGAREVSEVKRRLKSFSVKYL